MRIKQKIYYILEPKSSNDFSSKIVDLFIQILIVINIISIILSSFKQLEEYKTWFYIIELVSVIIFTLEYLLRVITATYKYPNEKPIVSIWKFIKSPMAIIDLLAILPFYLPFLIPFELRYLRVLRLTRTLRILKLNRYSQSLQLLGKILNKKKGELFITIFVTLILIIFASSAMYYIEKDFQPDKFPNIIASSWWAITTLTTVGYGDVSPVTVGGKIFSAIIALLGIGLVALPTGIISSGFIEEVQNTKKKRKPFKKSSYNKKVLNIAFVKKKKKSENNS